MGGKRLFCVFICVYGARKKRLTNFNICAGQLSSRCKMDSDEFSLVIKKTNSSTKLSLSNVEIHLRNEMNCHFGQF